MIETLVALTVAIISGLALQPWLQTLSQNFGHVDRPDNPRKRQNSPVPLSGGIAIIAAVGIGLFAASLTGSLASAASQFAALGIPCLIALAVGIVDDRRALNAGPKFAGQFLAATAAWYAGYGLEALSLPFLAEPLSLGIAAYPLTLLWYAACMNGYNFIDGCDGLAGGVAAVTCVALVAIGIFNENLVTTLAAAALLGATLPFLAKNRAPAQVYMGDAGAMAIGLLLAALALQPGDSQALLSEVSILLLAYPLFECATTTIRRLRCRLPLGRAELGHPHFVLQRRGNSPTRTACILCLGNLVPLALALASILVASTGRKLFLMAALIFAILACKRLSVFAPPAP